MSTQQQSAAQLILNDTQQIKAQTETIMALASTVTTPMEGERDSFMETVVKLLGMIVAGTEENRKSLEALHQRFDQPGIANTLRRIIDED